MSIEHVGIGTHATLGPGEHLIGGDGDWTDLLGVARILADLIVGQVGLGQQLAAPLMCRADRGHDDQRVGAGGGNGCQSDDCLARTAGQRQHAVAALIVALGPPGRQRIRLVRAKFGGELGPLQAGTPFVSGLIGGRPTKPDQRLLEHAAVACAHREPVAVQTVAQQLGHLLVAADLLEQCRFGRGEGKGGGVVVTHQPEPPVATHLIVHLGQHRRCHRILRQVGDRGGHIARTQPGHRGVPQRQRGDAVGVDVFGCLLQLGKPGQLGAGLLEARRGDLGEHGQVALHDQRVGRVGHRCVPLAAAMVMVSTSALS